jgi:putative phosphoesterase
MRIAILADVHGNHLALEAVTRKLKHQGVDVVAFLGDLVMNGPGPREALDCMEVLTPDVWIRGNTDEWFLTIGDRYRPRSDKERELLEAYTYCKGQLAREQVQRIVDHPIAERKSYCGTPITFCHGTPRSNEESIRPESDAAMLERIAAELERALLVFGHSRLPMNRALEDKTMISFGPVGYPLDADYGRAMELWKSRTTTRCAASGIGWITTRRNWRRLHNGEAFLESSG